jgi:hypothetical protein
MPDFSPAWRVGCASGSPTRQLPLAIPRGSGSDQGSPIRFTWDRGLPFGARCSLSVSKLACGLDVITIPGDWATACGRRAPRRGDDGGGPGPERDLRFRWSPSAVGCGCTLSNLCSKPLIGVCFGRMAEWLKAPVLKTGRGLRSLVGSNPTPSARPRVRLRSQNFIIVH